MICKIDGRVLGGMQFGVLVLVLLWGAVLGGTGDDAFAALAVRCSGGLGCCLGVLLDAGDGIGAFLRACSAG